LPKREKVRLVRGGKRSLFPVEDKKTKKNTFFEETGGALYGRKKSADSKVFIFFRRAGKNKRKIKGT
jgi:hypothetical protein